MPQEPEQPPKKQKYKTGDIVRLKSGGPDMTVKAYEFGQIVCQWFATKRLQTGRFDEGSLEPVTELEEFR